MIKYRADLYTLLPENAVIAELGCAECFYSSDILRWPNTKKMYLVDNWGTINGQHGDGASPQSWHDKNYSDGMMRVGFAIEKVKVLRGITWEMAANVEDESLDLLYLDACHTYDCVTKDLNAWYPKVKKWGIVAGHDFLNKSYGVRKAVEDFGKGFTIIPENKDEDAGFYFVKP